MVLNLFTYQFWARINSSTGNLPIGSQAAVEDDAIVLVVLVGSPAMPPGQMMELVGLEDRLERSDQLIWWLSKLTVSLVACI